MSTASRAAAKKRLGRQQIAESNATSPVRDVLDSSGIPARRKARLESSKAGVRNLLEGTQSTNKLKRLKRVLDRQSTDNSQ